MFVEDVLVAINNKITLSGHHQFGDLFTDNWYRSFISSVAQQVLDGRALSSNQSRVALKLIRSITQYLVEYGIASAEEINQILIAPQHHKPPYESTRLPREARYLGENFIGLRYKYDAMITAAIKSLVYTKSDEFSLTPPLSRARFDWTYKIWIVPVHHYNLSKIMQVLHEHRFHMDHTTSGYLRLCHDCIGKPSNVEFIDGNAALLIKTRDQDILADWITEIAGGIAL